MLCWVDEPVLRGIVTDRLVVQIHKKFEAAGIPFPYPRQELYLGRMAPQPEAES